MFTPTEGTSTELAFVLLVGHAGRFLRRQGCRRRSGGGRNSRHGDNARSLEDCSDCTSGTRVVANRDGDSPDSDTEQMVLKCVDCATEGVGLSMRVRVKPFSLWVQLVLR